MLFLDVFFCGALMLGCSGLCVALQVSHGPLIGAHEPTLTEHTSSAPAVSHRSLHDEPCFVDDVFALLREAVGNDGELTNSSLTQFGICTGSDSSSVLLELAKATSGNQRNGLEVLLPTGVLLAEEDERLTLTFDLPLSPLLKLSPVLLLAFESPIAGQNLEVIFTGQSLHPSAQTVCVSEQTQYLMLTGKTSEGKVHQKWKISVETKDPDMNQHLKEILIGGTSGSNVSVAPLLLFTVDGGTDTRYTHTPHSSPSQTSFLCELKRFLVEVLPRDQPESTVLKLDSMPSLPPLALSSSSSDTLLAGLINSSSVTIFSFAAFQVNRGELALSPALLEELEQRLEQTATQIVEVVREEELGQRATASLGRLKELSAFPKKEPAAGASQYRAFLLLKALQTVGRTYELKRGLRATRAGQSAAEGANVCGLKSLAVSLYKRLNLPNTIDINNCQGTCTYPMDHIKHHAGLLHFYIEESHADERAPCCVPVAYGGLEVVQLNEHGTYITMKPGMVALECECR